MLIYFDRFSVFLGGNEEKEALITNQKANGVEENGLEIYTRPGLLYHIIKSVG